MCVAAKGRLQGRAATLLLLWAGFSSFFFVFMQQKFHIILSSVYVFTMNANVEYMQSRRLRASNLSNFYGAEAGYNP